MTVSSNLLLFVVGAGILQGIFLACLIYYNPKGDRSVNLYLALYILCYCIPMLSPVVQHFLSWQFMIIIDPFLTLLGPFLYLYVSSFKVKITWQKAWPHYVFFFLFAVYDYYLYLTLMSHYPLSSQLPLEIPSHPLSIIRMIARIAQMVTYFFLARNALAGYRRLIHHMFSETSSINLNWVRWLINGYIILLFIMVGLYILILKHPAQFGLIILINTALVTPYLYAVTFKGMSQPTLWQIRRAEGKQSIEKDMVEVEAPEPVIAQHETKYQKDIFNPEKIDDIAARVTALMQEEKLYLNSELTLQDLADKLNVPAYLVTYAINGGLKKNFYDLVNGYRVEEAKRLLLDPKGRNSKILAVGLDAGFNSKTTFNTVFKKFTGFTPSDFKGQAVG